MPSCTWAYRDAGPPPMTIAMSCCEAMVEFRGFPVSWLGSAFVMLYAVIQGQSESWIHWLYTNAPAAWISSLIAIVTCFVLLSTRKRPSRLVVRELRSTSLVRIWPTVRDQIKMTFNEQPVSTLSQADAEIFNEGSDVIDRPTFTLSLASGSRVLGAIVVPAEVGAQVEIEDSKVIIRLPYLNPMRDHGQVLRLSVLADGDTDQIIVSGNGKGWSVRHSALPSRNELIVWDAAQLVFFVIGGAALFAYGRYVERSTGIRIDEVSWRAFIADLPVFVLLGVLFVGFILAKRWRRVPLFGANVRQSIFH